MNCENCCEALSISNVQKYQYTESGLENVFIDNIKVYSCANCDVRIPVIPKILTLHSTIGFAVVSKQSLLSGAEVKFLRKNLRIKAQDWAGLLRSKKETISRWENGLQSIGSQSDLLIRYLYLQILQERKAAVPDLPITEKLAEIINVETAVIIDTKSIESFSYLPLVEVLDSKPFQEGWFESFDLELNESNLYLGDVESILPSERLTDRVFNPFATPNQQSAANQELALAA